MDRSRVVFIDSSTSHRISLSHTESAWSRQEPCPDLPVIRHVRPEGSRLHCKHHKITIQIAPKGVAVIGSHNARLCLKRLYVHFTVPSCDSLRSKPNQPDSSTKTYIAGIPFECLGPSITSLNVSLPLTLWPYSWVTVDIADSAIQCVVQSKQHKRDGPRIRKTFTK